MADRINVWVVRYPDRPAFQLQWVDQLTGRRKTKSSGVRDTGLARDRKEAEAKARELEEQLRGGGSAIPSDLTWEAFCDRYDAEHAAGLAPKTRKKITLVADCVTANMNPRRLHDVTEERLSRFVATLRKKNLSESTIKSYLGQLRAALRWGVSQKLLPVCPAMPVIRRAKKAGSASPMKGRPITGEEFDRMIAATPKVVGEKDAPAWQHYLRGLWVSGLRLAESLELYWDREDRLHPILPRPGTGRPVLRVLAELEKGHSDRLLPIAPEFAVFLLETPEGRRTGRVFDLPRQRERDGDIRAEWVGKKISDIGEKAGVKVRTDPSDQEKVKYASAHDLRRSFGDRWAQRIMPAELQQLMRHESIETTLRYYVGANAERTADSCWQKIPGADAEYAAAFGGGEHNGSHNTAPVRAAS